MNRKTIAVDVDDVLATNARDFIEYTNQRWGTTLTIEDYDEHWMKVWQVDHDEAERRSEEFHAMGVQSRFTSHDGSSQVLARLHEKYRIIVVTSRRIMIEKETRAWLKKFYDGSIDEIYFSGIYDDLSVDIHTRVQQTKGDLLHKLGADFFIDDQPKHCMSADAHGIKAVLFGDYSWNRTAEIPDTIIRCHNWSEVARYFGV